MYRANVRIGQAFYPVLNHFEVFLRNALHHEISDYFSDPDWLRTEKDGFISDPSLAKGNYFLYDSVEKAEKKARRERYDQPSIGKLIAECTLGFWTSFFDPHHYRLLEGRPLLVFKDRPSSIGRHDIKGRLDEIRGFRNRLYHNEPICFSRKKRKRYRFDLRRPERVRNELCKLLHWMDPELKTYVAYFDNTQEKIERARALL